MEAESAVLPPDSAEARRYNRMRRWLGIAEFALSLALLVVLVITGWTGWLRDLAYQGAFQSYALAVFLYTVMLVVIGKILGLGMDYYSFRLEHRYQLSNQKLRGWIWDEVKGLLVSATLAAILVELLYFIIRQFSQHWWILAWLGFLGVAVLMAFPLGVVAAVKRGTAFDTVANIVAVLGQSLPQFWVGIVLIQIFAVRLRWLPVAGVGTLWHYVLPAFTLGWFVVAGMMRLLRSSMLDILGSEFVKLARIKGVPETAVIWKHALRNAMIPVLTFGAVYLAILVTGAILVETVFAWPGIGQLIYQGIVFRDFPVVQAVVLLTAGLVIAVNMLVDILYAYLDPRIRYR